jgi:hypothetical protein
MLDRTVQGHTHSGTDVHLAWLKAWLILPPLLQVVNCNYRFDHHHMHTKPGLTQSRASPSNDALPLEQCMDMVVVLSGS